MPDPIYDEINLITLKEIYPKTVEDNFFLNTPFLAYMRDHCLVPFGGGAFMQNVFLYAPLIGGFYAKGDNFNLAKRQTLAGTQFDPKYVEVNITEYKEDIQVIQKGAHAVFKLIDIDLENAMKTISAIVAIAIQNHGQAAGANIVGARANAINGWIEALNDGTLFSWDGSIFANYGTAPRNGVVGAALNSTPQWCGNADGSSAPITYQVLEETYQDASIGPEEPNLGVMNKAVFAFIKERIQPQQRFAQERDPIYGATGFRMNNAMMLKDDYFPSLKYGKNDPDLGNYLTGTIASNLGGTPNGNFPSANVTLTVGEVFCWFNTSKFAFRVSDDPGIRLRLRRLRSGTGQHSCRGSGQGSLQSGVLRTALPETAIRHRRLIPERQSQDVSPGSSCPGYLCIKKRIGHHAYRISFPSHNCYDRISQHRQ
jgi:hypothetical protein